MSIKTFPSTPFSNGMSYEFFLENFCYRCKNGKINPNGFAEYPENGGCATWDALENARFNVDLFPSNDIVRIEKDGEIVCWEVCKNFETEDTDLQEAYKKLFEEG